MKLNVHVGDRVRIHPDVTRTAWGPPCNWGGIEGTITRFGGRVGGHRLWRVLPDGSDCTFGGCDFAESVLERVQPARGQADLFTAEAA